MQLVGSTPQQAGRSTAVEEMAKARLTTHAGAVHPCGQPPKSQCTVCCASARPPAFLPTMPRIPSRLEGKRVSFFEQSGSLGTKSGLKPWTQASANQRPSRH